MPTMMNLRCPFESGLHFRCGSGKLMKACSEGHAIDSKSLLGYLGSVRGRKLVGISGCKVGLLCSSCNGKSTLAGIFDNSNYVTSQLKSFRSSAKSKRKNHVLELLNQ
jgi:hypothetical protein